METACLSEMLVPHDDVRQKTDMDINPADIQ
jgi:hypothetical protein